jgi:uncharacterized membrane protein YqiK
MSALFLAAAIPFSVLAWAIPLIVVMFVVPMLLGMKYIPNNRIGVVEKLWSTSGSVTGGHIIALDGEAGFQAELLRGGLHFGYWPWYYRIHSAPLTVIAQGKIGYVFARDGEPLTPQQTLGRVVPCNTFQDARAFLNGDAEGKHPAGQRGRQRAILREGVYAINPALFVVVTEDRVYRLLMHDQRESATMDTWRKELLIISGFDPVVISRSVETPSAHPVTIDSTEEHPNDVIGIVTVHDGPALPPGHIIAPAVASDPNDADYHNNYQDIEAFLRAGGRRGRQFVPLTDGTYFLNHWFASVERIPKTVVPIGCVGVVVSYYGNEGTDLSGISFRHGERVGEGERGVQAKTLGPGKYPFNTYAGHVHLVPTTNFVLHWITGRHEQHRFDETLKSIDLVTADAYEPVLPLSVVVHIDYQKAASVVQRFGDVKKLITQTLDPMLSAYFRDIAHKKAMLELLHDRDLIQAEARKELRQRFSEFDIELVDVLIGKPDTVERSGGGDIETLLQQLRLRQLSREQIQTYEQQRGAAEKLKDLKMAQALAERQTDLTASEVQISIAQNQGEAELARGRRRAEQMVVEAEAERKRKLLQADAESQSLKLLGDGESQRVRLEGEAQAKVLMQKIASYGDPRLFALSLVAQHLAQSKQPLVPQQMFLSGSNGNGHAAEQGLLGTLIDLLVAEKIGLSPNGHGKVAELTATASLAPVDSLVASS